MKLKKAANFNDGDGDLTDRIAELERTMEQKCVKFEKQIQGSIIELEQMGSRFKERLNAIDGLEYGLASEKLDDDLGEQ